VDTPVLSIVLALLLPLLDQLENPLLLVLLLFKEQVIIATEIALKSLTPLVPITQAVSLVEQ
jgi:hypothetical protein